MGRSKPQQNPTTGRAAAILAACLIALAVVAVFRQTLAFDFVNFDDDVYVYGNPELNRGLSADGVAWAFTSTRCNNWHPLTWLSLLADRAWLGPLPWGFHFTNVVLHAAAAVVLFLAFRQMTGDLRPSAFAAALFAVHPLRAESVAWIAERKDVLSGLFFMLTLAAYAGYARRSAAAPCGTAAFGRADAETWSTAALGREKRIDTAGGGRTSLRYAAVVLLFALGLMAKPMLVTMPFVLLLLDYWPLRRMTSGTFRRLVVEKLPLFVLAAASCVVTSLVQGIAIQSFEKFSLAVRLENALIATVAYAGQFFYPVGLAAFYPHPGANVSHWHASAAALLLAGLSAFAVARRRQRPWLAVGWFWFLGMLVPVIGLVQVGAQAMADRYTYLPQIGLAAAFSWEAKHWVALRPRLARPIVAAALVFLAALAVTAHRQTAYWRDGETLWRRALQCTAGNESAHISLGNLYYQQGRTAEAVEQFQKALQWKPENAVAHNNLGLALADLGRLDEAEAHYCAALKADSRYAEALNNLGNVFLERKQFDAAEAKYQKALEVKPDYPDARYNLGLVYYQSGRPADTIAEWDKLLHSHPDNVKVLDRTAWILATHPDASVRNGARAVELARRAAKLTNFQHPTMLDTLAAAEAESGRFAEAVAVAKQALALLAGQNDAGAAAMAEAVKSRMERYRSGAPYRETPSADTPDAKKTVSSKP